MDRIWESIDRALPALTPVRSHYAPAFLVSGLALCVLACVHGAFGFVILVIFGIMTAAISASEGGMLPAVIAALVYVMLGMFMPDRSVAVGKPIDSALLALLLVAAATAGEMIARLRSRTLSQTCQLAQREAYLQSVFEALPAAMVVIDEAGKILSANRSACRIFQLQSASGRSIHDLIELNGDVDVASEVLRREALSRLTGAPVIGRSMNGQPLLLAMSVTRTVTREGPLLTVYLRDETATRKANDRLAELQDEVAQLGRAAALGAMGSAIAHELNQPLTSAANYNAAAKAYLAQSGLPSIPARLAIDEALAQILRAGSVVRRLRAFVQSTPQSPEWLDVREVVDEAAHLGHFILRDRRAELVLDLDRASGYMLADRVQVQQVLLNLINNAADAVSSCERRVVRISTEQCDAGRLTIRISDSGPGLSPAVRERLFKPFNTSKAGGLGVGLSISRSIVEAHGGRIWSDDTQAEGASFCFTVTHRDHQEREYAA